MWWCLVVFVPSPGKLLSALVLGGHWKRRADAGEFGGIFSLVLFLIILKWFLVQGYVCF